MNNKVGITPVELAETESNLENLTNSHEETNVSLKRTKSNDSVNEVTSVISFDKSPADDIVKEETSNETVKGEVSNDTVKVGFEQLKVATNKSDENNINEKKEDKKEEVVEEGERGQFSNTLEFFFSTLGYAVGVGNVWRFPYLAYRNGGGVFLIPYFIFMVLIGFPMVYLEFVVGQFTSRGPLTAWTMTKISRGIGISMNIANTLYVIYYNLIIAYSIYFLFVSFTTELPWEKCSDWSSYNCVDNYDKAVFAFDKCENITTQFKCMDDNSLNYGRCFNLTDSIDFMDSFNMTNCNSFLGNETLKTYWKPTFPSQDYWQRKVLQQSLGLDESGKLIWQLALALFVTYVIVYGMLIGGVAIFGKLVYFIVTFPYLVLIILGIKGWTLDGADIGIKYYVIPKWDRLGDIKVWSDAATQIFFTLAISYGGMSTFASYNKFSTNVMRDALIIPMANCITSFFAGFVIFAYMGYLSKLTGQEMSDVVQAGQGLAFVVYPYAVTTIAGAPVWSCLFFFMLVLLGLDSTLGSVEVTIRSVLDTFPVLEKRKYVTITCIFIFYYVCGLLFCIQSGAYWMELFNNYAGDWSILVTAMLECLIMSYLYGLKNLKKDIRCMLGSWAVDTWTWYIWCGLWGFVSPGIMITIIIVTWTQLKPITLGDYVFPEWSLPVGQLMTASIMLGWMGWALYCIIDAIRNKQNILDLFKPTLDNYLPAKEKNKIAVQIARGRYHKSGVTATYDVENKGFEGEETTVSYL